MKRVELQKAKKQSIQEDLFYQKRRLEKNNRLGKVADYIHVNKSSRKILTENKRAKVGQLYILSYIHLTNNFRRMKRFTVVVFTLTFLLIYIF